MQKSDLSLRNAEVLQITPLSKRGFSFGFRELSTKSAHPALFLGYRCAIVRPASKFVTDDTGHAARRLAPLPH
ncbi:hypothetical protein ABIC08_001328 [Bradyrhizobium sp. RT9b]